MVIFHAIITPINKIWVTFCVEIKQGSLVSAIVSLFMVIIMYIELVVSKSKLPFLYYSYPTFHPSIVSYSAS